ncbi:MAG: radical SAM protein [Acidobacteria bacterium]|nr:radical SAM protein [Acidobacteriota bacterium]
MSGEIETGRGATGTAESALRSLLDAIPATTSKGEFLARADAAGRDLARRFEAAGGSTEFARLLALKTVNLAVGRYHYLHRHTNVASRPAQLLLDPVNNCHLGCPGCVHSRNRAVAANYDWPGGRMSPEAFERALADFGLYAFGVAFYNWGEPLLHKELPRFVRAAKSYLLHTSLSSNLSLPFDAEALVASGLNFLFVAVDGASQESYERFRRGGDLRLCLDNMTKLVRARERAGSTVPYILWRFLTFEHNLHEVDRAIEIARDLGVDQISISTPFAVDWDDPGVRVARSEREGVHQLRPGATFKGPLDDWRNLALPSEEIARAAATPWRERLGAGPVEEASAPAAGTCGWLYQSLTLDAVGRVLPCCMPPVHDLHRVYGRHDEAGAGAFNLEDYRLSRLAFADRAAYERAIGARDVSAAPFCAVCDQNPEMSYDVERDVGRDLRLLAPESVLSDATVRDLTAWGDPLGAR